MAGRSGKGRGTCRLCRQRQACAQGSPRLISDVNSPMLAHLGPIAANAAWGEAEIGLRSASMLRTCLDDSAWLLAASVASRPEAEGAHPPTNLQGPRRPRHCLRRVRCISASRANSDGYGSPMPFALMASCGTQGKRLRPRPRRQIVDVDGLAAGCWAKRVGFSTRKLALLRSSKSASIWPMRSGRSSSVSASRSVQVNGDPC